ncbi:MAG TPA: hypothetical protein GX391_10720 [Firmicutes bacterium]|nr:hypothetical protein [Bacillota bacterium]
MYRLLLASNFCLDMPLPEYAANARLCRRQESLACLKAFFNEAIQQKYDAAIISGNLFARPYPSREAWEALNEGYERLKQANISLLLLEGDKDRGPIYREPVHDLPVLAKGQNKELLPGLAVGVRSTSPVPPGQITLWHRETWPAEVPKNALVLTSLLDARVDLAGLIRPGIPLRLDFDLPNEPTVTKVDWAGGPQNIEDIPFPDRIYVTFHWNVDERGEDLAAYLEAHQDPELCLRIIISGRVKEPMPVEAWLNRFRNGFFLLKLEDRTKPECREDCPPLILDQFNKILAEKLDQADFSVDQARLYRRVWQIGLWALKGGERGAN